MFERTDGNLIDMMELLYRI